MSIVGDERTPAAVIIGLSNRTDRTGAEALVSALGKLGKPAVVAETPPGVLHFKTGCGMIDEETVFAVPALADGPAFAGLRVLVTPAGEEAAANILRIRDTMLIGEGHPRSRELIEAHGIETVALPVSEIAKIDAKLGNEAFVSKAKPEVVEEQKERRAEADAVRHKLSDAVKRISG